MRTFSMAGYFFGRELNQKLNRPIGLVESAWGGTPVEAWTPIEVFNQSEKLATSAAKLTPAPWCPMRPAVTFNAMIYPIINYPVAGAIWYQGETNTANPSTYEQTFSAMIHSWRELWHKDFPFYFVQIAPYSYGTPYSAALVREAQLQTYRHVPKTGIVVTTDITGDTTNIHPLDKLDVGERPARWALSQTYGRSGIVTSGPLYKSMDIKGNKAIIHFDFADDGLMKKGKELRDFVIAGEDHQFVPATAKIENNTVVVYNRKVKHPVAVRMGFTNTDIPNLFNKAGLPASPFRTDDWPIKLKK
jgi:sialate O-acetylesterase